MALSGSSTIPAGSTSVTITHTYGASPPVVQIEPQSFLNGNEWRVINKTTTQFTVQLLSVDFANAFVFDWAVLGTAESAAPSETQYCTVAKAKESAGYLYTELGFASDVLYEAYIAESLDRLSRAIDRFTQRPDGFFNGGATITEIVDAKTQSTALYSNTDRAASQAISKREYFLKHAPVISVTSVAKNTADIGSSDSWTTISASSYRRSDNRIVFSSSADPSEGQMNVRFIYVAGYNTVPNEIRWACEDLYANVAKKALQDQTNGRVRFTRAAPISFKNEAVFTDDVKLILEPYRKVNS